MSSPVFLEKNMKKKKNNNNNNNNNNLSSAKFAAGLLKVNYSHTE